MLKIQRNIELSASHQLDKLPETHKCSRLHGHNYNIEVEISAKNGTALDENGMLLDFGEIDTLIKGRYDHQHLNDFPEFQGTTTSEVFVFVIRELIQGHLDSLNRGKDPTAWMFVSRVKVAETAKSFSEWSD